MNCKFLKHGLSISYEAITQPCCVFKYDEKNSLSVYDTNLSTYHDSDYLKSLSTQMQNGVWPKECVRCQVLELQNKTSMRQNGNEAYKNYNDADITLEIRPGNVCNFACQTCWPAASSRVTAFYQKAGLDVDNPTIGPGINRTNVIKDYTLLSSIASRIKDVIILGGEPFYDKHCLSFMHWAIKNLKANITLFSNTSIIKEDLIRSYGHTFTIVSSIDAIGKPAEYIRFGTTWKDVDDNFKKLKTFKNVTQRVNITCSAYNFYFIDDIIHYLINDWPEVVSFGTANSKHFNENVIPLSIRPKIIEKLNVSIASLQLNVKIKLDQRQNAIQALTAIRDNLAKNIYDLENHQYLKNFTKKMDMVKNINHRDYHEYFVELLS